jgi:hypothetical protein
LAKKVYAKKDLVKKRVKKRKASIWKGQRKAKLSSLPKPRIPSAMESWTAARSTKAPRKACPNFGGMTIFRSAVPD